MGEQKLGEAIDRGGGDEPAHFTKADVVAAVRKLWETCLATPPPKSSQDLWREHQELRQRIGEIHRMQLAAGGPQVELHPNKRSEEDIHGFLKWTEKVGIRFNGVTIAGGDAVEAEGFGLVSTRPLEPGEKVIVVPRKAMLSLDLAKKSALMKRVFQRDAITASMDNVGLALFVAIQRLQPDSSWTPYFKVLPGQFYTPLHYSKEELELLRGSPVFEEVLLMYRLAARMFAHFHLMIAKNDDYDAAKTGRPGDQPPLYGAPFTVLNFTFDLYRWAMTVVTTRINLIPSELETLDSGEPKQITALIPGLDMANHAFLPDDPTGEASDTLMGVDESKEFAELLVTRRFDTEGEEIRSFYGKRTNSEFLMHNGFVPDGKNPWDRYRLKIGIPTSDKHVAARVAAADKLGFTDSGSRVYVFNIWRSAEFAEKKGAEADSLQGTAPFATALERFVRIFVADPPTQEVIDKVDTAKKAANWLKSRFELLLRPYQTLGEVDELAAPLTAVYANRLKTGEKEILQAALTFCQSWVRALEQST